MFHCGINKIGRHSTLNESRASGYPNDCPILSYFEHTAISPYGETGDTYRLLNLLHLFVRDFGSLLAPLPYVPSPEKPTPDNTAALRYAMRSDGTRGFVFVNQYQRLRCMQRVEDVRFDTGTVCFPPLTVPGGASFILPFGLELCGETLTYATAQPICRDGNAIFFAALDGIEPCYCFGSTAYRPAALPDTHRFGDLCVVTLPFAQALYLRKLNGQVVLGDGCDVYTADNQIHAVQPGNFAYSVWNGMRFVQHSVQKPFSPAVLQEEPLDTLPFLPPYRQELQLGTSRNITCKRLTVTTPEGFVEIPDVCDTAQIYADGVLVVDEYYCGVPWRIPARLLYGRDCYLFLSEWKDDIYCEF